ncbi:MAG: sugar phosphate isomerase/epimerase [Spirochaetales bacterium]|nr:sugar phosphate isomerase/epimerase [Spirochaetales bacterium]
MSILWAKMVENLADVKRAVSDGFDRFQPTIEFLMTSGEEFRKQGVVIPEVCSSPLPPDARVTQMGFNIYVWTEYLKKAVRSAAAQGCEKLTWSDGRARILPLEGDVSLVKEQVLQFLYLLCEIAENFGITVLVEPLGPRRTNFLNSMEEMADFLPLVGKENLSSMISLRELSEIGLKTEEFERYARLITHVQMENPLVQDGRRLAPRRNDSYDYVPFLRALRRIGYKMLITLPEDADVDSLEYCRELWDAADEAT